MHKDTTHQILGNLDDDEREHAFLSAAVCFNGAHRVPSDEFVRKLDSIIRKFDEFGDGLMPPLPLAVLSLRAAR